MRPDFDGVPGTPPRAAGLGARPQGEAFVMLRGQHYVLRPGAKKDVRPVVRIVKVGPKHWREVLIGKVGAVHAFVERPRGSARRSRRQIVAFGNGVPIPLRILLFLRYAG